MTNNQTYIANRKKTKLHRWFKNVYACRHLYYLILPGIISVVIFHYIPIYGVQIAFKEFRTSLGIWGSDWIGLKYFIKFVTYPDFWGILRNTAVIGLYTIATTPCAVIFALMLNEIENKPLKKSIQMLTYAPHFVSTVVVASILILFLDRSNGLINNIVAFMGGERQAFIGNPKLFSTIYVWSGVWQGLGWSTIIYLAALSTISPEMIEAAKIDGASQLQIILKIKIPSILPTIMTILILSTGKVLSVGFEKIYLLQNPLNLSHSRVISTYVYEVGLLSRQFSYSAAIGLFNNAVNIAFILLINTLSKRITKVGLW